MLHSSSFTAELEPILRALSLRNIKILSPTEASLDAINFLERITDTIRKADLLIGMVDSESSNANVFFEIGFAHALDRRILVLAPEGILPSNIQGLLSVPSGTDNLEALSFALDQPTVAPRPTRYRRGKLPRKSKAIGDKAGSLLRELDRFGEAPFEREIERAIKSALEESGISTLAQAQDPDFGADFAI